MICIIILKESLSDATENPGKMVLIDGDGLGTRSKTLTVCCMSRLMKRMMRKREPVMYVSLFGLIRYYIPVSDSMFKLSAKNAKNISLVYRDIDEIEDIADIDGDGKVLNTEASVSDLYGSGIDITEALDNPAGKLVHIELARVKPSSYTGEEVKPVVTYRGKVLRLQILSLYSKNLGNIRSCCSVKVITEDMKKRTSTSYLLKKN